MLKGRSGPHVIAIVIEPASTASFPVPVMAADAGAADKHHAFQVPPECGVEREIDDGIVTRVRHGEPMGAQPHDVHVRQAVDVWVMIAHDGDDVQG